MYVLERNLNVTPCVYYGKAYACHGERGASVCVDWSYGDNIVDVVVATGVAVACPLLVVL